MRWYVYAAVSGEYVKYGHTSNLRRRFSALAAGLPNELGLLWALEFSSLIQARDAELVVHRIMGEHRVRGEWFTRDEDRHELDAFEYALDMACRSCVQRLERIDG